MPRKQQINIVQIDTSSDEEEFSSESPSKYTNVLLEEVLAKDSSNEDDDMALFGDNFQADRENQFGAALNGVSPDDKKKRSQMDDAKRKLNFKMQNASDVATSWWGTIRTSVMTKEDVDAESKLLNRLDQLTIDYMIGPKIEKSFRRGADGSFGFQVGSSQNLRGSRISSVYPGGTASESGLDVGDVVMEIQGKDVFGEKHDTIVGMIERLDHLEMKVAQLLDVDLPTNNVPLMDIADRPKPPSYMKIRNQLINECGEVTYNRCKRRVQIRMQRLSDRFDAMSGNAKEGPIIFSQSTLNQLDSGWEKTKVVANDTFAGVKRWVASKIAVDDHELERDDADRLAQTRATSNDMKLHEALSTILTATQPLDYLPDCFVNSADDKTPNSVPQLSYSGVRAHLIDQTSTFCFDRNRGYVQQKLQQREIEKLTSFSKPKKVVSDITIGYDSNEVHIQL